MEELINFAKQYPVKTFKPKEIILHQGDRVSCGYFILKGRVRVYDISNEGDEKPLSYDKTREIFPVAVLYLNMKRAQYYYEAHTKCDIAIIPKDEYINFVKTHPEALFATTVSLAKRHLDFNRRVNGLTQLKAETKVLFALKYFGKRHGKKTKDDKVTVEIPVTQSELANFSGLTRETVSSVMNKLKRRNIVKYRGKTPMKIDEKKVDKDLEI